MLYKAFSGDVGIAAHEIAERISPKAADLSA
jgi:hypothetical protein